MGSPNSEFHERRKTDILFAVFGRACAGIWDDALERSALCATRPSSQQQYPSQQPAQGSEQQPRQPGQTPDQSGQQAPDSQSQSQQPGVQVFTGVIVKSGDKYVLQDSDSGTTYDIDHQDQVKQFEGKKVRVQGTLDSNGKMIHVQ
jgi:hypothetical protein